MAAIRASRAAILHGHVHNNEPLRLGRYVNICVEHTDYRPLPQQAVVRLAAELVAGRPPACETAVERLRGDRRTGLSRTGRSGRKPAPSVTASKASKHRRAVIRRRTGRPKLGRDSPSTLLATRRASGSVCRRTRTTGRTPMC